MAAALAEDRQATEASADFTAFIRLTVFHQLIVGKFYNSPCGEIPLTIAFGLPERVNPVGTRFASMKACWRRLHSPPLTELSGNGTGWVPRMAAMIQGGSMDFLETVRTDETIGDAIRRWTELSPRKPAFLTDDGRSIAYGRLAALLDGIGRHLNALSVGCGDRIAIVHPNGPRLAVLLFGVSSASTVVPLNPALAEGEYQRLLEDLRVDALVTLAGSGEAARRAAQCCSVPVFDLTWAGPGLDDEPRIDGAQLDRPFRSGRAGANDVAFVLGTSGTTGRSKIVPITHRLFMSRVVTRQTYEQISPADRCIFLNPLFLHNGLSTVGVTLASGASMIFMPTFRADTFFRCIGTLQPTWFNGSFTYVKSIIEYARTEGISAAPGQFRFLRPTSGAVDPADSVRIEEIFGAPVIELLSSTECGHVAVNPLPPGRRKHGSVGKAADCEIRILGEDETFLPFGEEGEVIVRGVNVFAGYENDVAANEAAFFDGWYRTGDRGFLDEDGYLTLTGRIKEMINRGGEKISPTEVDAILMQHPDIADAAAFAIPHPTLSEIVGAAIVLASGANIASGDISAFLRGRLSTIKRPNAYLFVDEIPRSPLGKIRRGELAAMFERMR